MTDIKSIAIGLIMGVIAACMIWLVIVESPVPSQATTIIAFGISAMGCVGASAYFLWLGTRKQDTVVEEAKPNDREVRVKRRT
jgi:hypothetical protein